jgi:transaldolase
MERIRNLRVKIFADGADLDGILKLNTNPQIKGFTTNPTLMRKAGVADYESFARQLLSHVTDKPISFEVFADEFDEMIAQGQRIASWGRNVNVKIPVTNTRGEFAGNVIKQLTASGIAVNVTAVLTLDQVKQIAECLAPGTPSIVSVFAGRVADTGRDPVPMMAEAVRILAPLPRAELLWASPRELLNLVQADEIGCHIITVTSDILNKLALIGKDLEAYSLETVAMFRKDALAAGFKIDVSTDLETSGYDRRPALAGTRRG